MQSPSFKIGASADSHLEVTVSARAHPACTDYWDGNWVRANVAIATGAFRGTYEATLRSEELLGFKNQLRPLGGALDGSATFNLDFACWTRDDRKVVIDGAEFAFMRRMSVPESIDDTTPPYPHA